MNKTGLNSYTICGINKVSKYINRTRLVELGIIVFTLFLVTQRLIDLYSHLRLFQFAIVGFALVLIFIGILDRNFFFKKITPLDIVWLPAITFIFFYILMTNYNVFNMFIYSAGFGFLFLAKVDITSFMPAILIIKFGALFYALGSIAQYISPENFNNFILNFTSKYSESELMHRVDRNYYPGFGFNRTALAASYIAVGIGAILTFWNNHKYKVILNLCFLFFLILALVITGKRGLLLWAAVALPLTFIALAPAKEQFQRLLKVSLVIFVSFATLMIILQLQDLPTFLVRIESLISGIISGEYFEDNVRLSYYKDAWAHFLQEPLHGIGWKHFEIVNPRGEHVHNIYLQLLTETGVVGFILIITPLVYSLLSTYKALRASINLEGLINHLWTKGLAFSLFYQLLFLLYGLTDSPLYGVRYVFLYFLVLALVNSFNIINRELLKNT